MYGSPLPFCHIGVVDTAAPAATSLGEKLTWFTRLAVIRLRRPPAAPHPGCAGSLPGRDHQHQRGAGDRAQTLGPDADTVAPAPLRGVERLVGPRAQSFGDVGMGDNPEMKDRTMHASLKKGDVLATARIAGVMAGKRTAAQAMKDVAKAMDAAFGG